MLNLPEYKFTYDDFNEYVLSERAFEKGCTFHIGSDGKDRRIDTSDYPSYLAQVQVLLAQARDTLKVECFDSVIGFVEGTVHVYRYWRDSPSFAEHVDDVDVIIQVKDGWKIMEMDGFVFNIPAGNTMYIPKGNPHRAVNGREGLMFSYGLHNNR
jgi:mannose-6-phosphate isomerase-like protein (cupin superfamily)